MPARFFLPRDVSRLLAHHGLGRYNLPMRNNQRSAPLHGTTVLCVRKDNKVVLVADGQVTVGEHVLKHTKLTAKDLAMKAMRIASEICIFTNANFTVEEL